MTQDHASHGFDYSAFLLVSVWIFCRPGTEPIHIRPSSAYACEEQSKEICLGLFAWRVQIHEVASQNRPQSFGIPDVACHISTHASYVQFAGHE